MTIACVTDIVTVLGVETGARHGTIISRVSCGYQEQNNNNNGAAVTTAQCSWGPRSSTAKTITWSSATHTKRIATTAAASVILNLHNLGYEASALGNLTMLPHHHRQRELRLIVETWSKRNTAINYRVASRITTAEIKSDNSSNNNFS